MQFLILVILFCFFIFLFVLHFLSRDDFVLLRKDVSVDKLFNIAFMLLPISLLTSRLLYVVSNPSANFLNPLYFLLFPYFPGLSFIGGVLAVIGSLYLISGSSKMPGQRLLDLFVFSVVSVMPLGSLGYFLLNGKIISWQSLFFFINFTFLFILFYFFFLPKFQKGRIKEGNMWVMFLAFVSFITLVSEFIFDRNVLSVDNIVLGLTLIASGGFYIQKEKLIFKFKSS